jgi:hypothetical protein
MAVWHAKLCDQLRAQSVMVANTSQLWLHDKVAMLYLTCLQESGLLNRPEIPHLANMNQPLLVKAYDLGLIDARGKTEARVIAEMLATADAQVGLSEGAVAGFL